jgi:GDP-L-fucose synthase
MIRKLYLAKCLMEDDIESIRKDLAKRPVENTDDRADKEQIVSVLAKYGIEKGKLSLWGTGNVFREFLWSEDMADASVHILLNVDFKDTYSSSEKEIRNCHINIGTGKEITIRELAEKIKKEIGYMGTILWNSDKPDGTPRKLTDVSKLHSLGWQHRIEIDEGIHRLTEWYKNN